MNICITDPCEGVRLVNNRLELLPESLRGVELFDELLDQSGLDLKLDVFGAFADHAASLALAEGVLVEGDVEGRSRLTFF